MVINWIFERYLQPFRSFLCPPFSGTFRLTWLCTSWNSWRATPVISHCTRCLESCVFRTIAVVNVLKVFSRTVSLTWFFTIYNTWRVTPAICHCTKCLEKSVFWAITSIDGLKLLARTVGLTWLFTVYGFIFMVVGKNFT